MQIIALRTLRRFWERHPQAETPVRLWYASVSKASWDGPADVKADFGASVDFIADSRLIFDVGGNKYRLVVHVAYRYKRVLVKFIGTHAEYDRTMRALYRRGSEIMPTVKQIRQESPADDARIRPIRTEDDYDAALREIEAYFDREPDPGTPQADRFDILATLISAYEREHWPIDPPEPIDAIKYCMELRGYTQSDLARLLGSRSRASEILNRRRPLTMDMAWELHREWGIPAESLMRPYHTEGTRASEAAPARPVPTKRLPKS